MIILFYFFSQKMYPVNYEIFKILGLIALGVILFYISGFLSEINLLWRILIKITLIFLFPWILYLFNFYEKIEIEHIKKTWLKWRNPLNWKNNINITHNGE